MKKASAIPSSSTILSSWLAQRRKIINKLLRHLDRQPSVKVVHDLRTSARRLRAIAELLGPKRSEDLGRVAGRVMKALAQLREHDVAAASLAHLGVHQADPELEPARRWLSKRIAKKRTRLARCQRAKVRRRAKVLAARLGSAVRTGQLSISHAPLDDLLVSRSETQAAAVARLVRSLGAQPAFARLHRIRVAVKHWRYAAELRRDLFGDVQAARSEEMLAHVQDSGGHTQDMVDLVDRLAKEQRRLRNKAGRKAQARRHALERLQLTVIEERKHAADAFLASLHALNPLQQPGPTQEIGRGRAHQVK